MNIHDVKQHYQTNMIVDIVERTPTEISGTVMFETMKGVTHTLSFVERIGYVLRDLDCVFPEDVIMSEKAVIRRNIRDHIMNN